MYRAAQTGTDDLRNGWETQSCVDKKEVDLGDAQSKYSLQNSQRTN